MTEFDAQNARTKTIVGDDEDQSFEQAIERFYQHLTESLQLPCDVTGIEDFDWEEYYVLGPGDYAEYNKLRKTQPSYQDIFELLAIEKETGVRMDDVLRRRFGCPRTAQIGRGGIPSRSC